MDLKILSIDIGIINLGYVYTHFKNDKVSVLECNRVNITLMRHRCVKLHDCKLRHEFCIPDYLDHFIQEHLVLFEEADILLIERQPPMGITNVQDLLFTRFRDKVKLVSPNAVHKFFKMDALYDTRKIQSEQIAKEYLSNFETFTLNDRKHDISDALLLVLWYTLTLKHPKKQKSVEIIDFDTFRYIPLN